MDESGPLYTVVGIYAHMTMMGLDDRQSPYGIVFPMGLQSDGGYRSIAVRTRGDAQRVLPDMRAALRELDPALPVYELESARTSLSETIDQPRLLAGVMPALSAVALLLAAIGIYGVLAYAATRRRREMGIRMALGAAPSGVRALIVRQGVAVSLAGVVVGLGCATVMSRFAGSLLYGVQPGDPVTLTGAALVLLGVAIVASWLPARRATNVDPVDVLRAE
jgi:ABC-type antimicrobial peptide transport system permease subunit